MSLNETVQQRLGDWRPDDGRQTLAICDEAAGWNIRLTADRHDDLVTAIWELELQRFSTGDQTLQSWAGGVTARTTGLLEPLCVVEIDDHRHEALLRSLQPTHRREDLYYYEIILSGIQRAVARRYRGHAVQGRREQIPFTLTHEALVKLAVDLVG